MQQLKLGRSSKQIDQTAQKALLTICIFICLYLAFFKLTLDFRSIALSAHIFCDYHLIYRPDLPNSRQFCITQVRNCQAVFLGDCVDKVLADMDFSDDLNSRYLRLVKVKTNISSQHAQTVNKSIHLYKYNYMKIK